MILRLFAWGFAGVFGINFVHISAVEASGLKTLNEKDKVSYDVTNERGKTAACNIKLV